MLATRRHRERGRHGHGPMSRLRDDAGAVAILVALSVSTFLLGFAALAVDFGQVYTRHGELQSVADAVALAGATELPDIPDARRKAVETLCAPANRLGDWPPNTCPANPDDADWADDGSAANGEILFYGQPNNLGEFAPPALTRETDQAMAIQVELPPSTVTFGLARTFGADDLEVTKAATARVGTPIGTGFLPFAVTPEDLSQDSRNRQFCVVDRAIAGAPAPGGYPGPTGRFPLLITVSPFQIGAPTTGQVLTVRPLLGRFAPLPRTNPMFVVIDGHRIPSTDHNLDRAIVRVDVDLAPGPHVVWIEAGVPRSFVSDTTTLTVDGAGAGADPCDRPDARGVLNIGRSNQSGDVNGVLSDNIKTGIEPTPHRYNEFPAPLLGGTLGLAFGRSCVGVRNVLGVVFQILASILGPGGYRPDINCVNTRNRNFSDGLTRGLLDASGANPGRLLRRCSDADPVTTHNVTIDGTDLQDVTDETLTGGFPIEELVQRGDVARAAITAEAFACPRLGIVPVINPGPQLLQRDGQYPIVDFAYVWIQDDAEGLVFENGGNRLRAVKFWVIDPAFFGRTVSGSPKVGPYLGPQFPREVLLVKNPGED